MKDARQTTASQLNPGDEVKFLNIPYFKEDLRLFYSVKTVKEIEVSSSGKRCKVHFTDGTRACGNGGTFFGFNTILQELSEENFNRLKAERGIKI